MLKNLPGEVLNLWNNWEIRGMVLLSLLLQTILIISGPLRKTIAIVWIRILIWSAYLSADMVATFALGNLARSQGDSSGNGSKKANNSIQSLWAPFLLLHLGGPDTITAYSIEDNELWLRHLLGLVVQVGVTFYVFSRSWGNGILPFIAIPMFIVGIIKYSERTWVLWSSCSKSLRNSSLLGFWTSFLRTTKPESDQQREYLRQAYTFFHISKFTMQDLVPTSMYLMLSHLRFSKIPADIALKVVEVELGLIYDMLYTKAPLIYSRSGIILRCISFLLYITAFIIFQVKIEKHAYSSIDVAITYLLFVAAAFLELYAFLCLVFSDHTLIWLVDKGGNAWASTIYSWVRKLTTSKRWSRSISQYSLARVCTENKSRKCLELVGIDEMMRQMHVNRKDLNGGLHEFIFKHLQKKAKEENLNLLDKKIRSKITGQRGDGVLERMGVLQNYKWCTIELEFSQSILVWHLATEICYLDTTIDTTSVQKDASNEKDDAINVSRSKCLSDYMMYLLVIRPNMLSIGFGDKEYKHTLIMLSDKITSQNSINTDYTAVNHGFMLAGQLLESISECKKRWEMIEEVWMEILTYAAAHCPWKEHAHQLRRGGELLTHVCLLMLHLGLSKQYEFKGHIELTPEDSSIHLKEEEIIYYLEARNKYLDAIEDLSRLSPDEEELRKARDKYLPVFTDFSISRLNKVKEIIADKDRDLEHEKREPEQKEHELKQFRSCFTTSTSHQRIDSFPKSSVSQTNNQGIGQPSSKINEISLSID